MFCLLLLLEKMVILWILNKKRIVIILYMVRDENLEAEIIH